MICLSPTNKHDNSKSLAILINFTSCSEHSEKRLWDILLITISYLNLRISNFSFYFWIKISTLIIPGGNHCDFCRTKLLLDLRAVCKLEFVRFGPVEKDQSALSVSVNSWRPDEVREHLFPNREIEIFQSIPSYTYLSPCKIKICKIHLKSRFEGGGMIAPPPCVKLK